MGFNCRKNYRLFLVLICLFTPRSVLSLTLEEAIALARQHLPAYQASKIRVQSTQSLYKASLSPYLPTLDVSGLQERRRASSDEFNLERYDATLSYLLFDGGRRRADRNIAQLTLDSDREDLRRNLLLLEGDVKRSFYRVMAAKEFVEQRQLQLQDAQKDHEIAKGRHRAGAAKRSDVLQVSVRLQEARLELRRAQGGLANSLYDLNSLIGRPLDTPYDLEGTLGRDVRLPEKDRLARAALERPEVQQARNGIKISENEKSKVQSRFYPDLSLDLTYSKTDTDQSFADISTESKSAGVFATWNLFELDKFFEKQAAALDIGVSTEQLNEEKRLRLLEVQTAYEDFVTAYESLALARHQLRDAAFNYEQALGEYKVGKGDILSLVRAESALADARRAVTLSRLDFAFAEADLEQAAGIRDLESMQKVEVPEPKMN